MVVHNRHRETGVFRLLNRHLTVAICIYVQNIACGLWCSYGFRFTFCEPERFVHFVRVHIVEGIDDDISSETV